MSKFPVAPNDLGTPDRLRPGHWVQTERKAHEAWANLVRRKPRAAELLHHLVASMAAQNALVASQQTLSKLLGCSVDTVQRALKVLVAERYIQVVKINGQGSVAAYVVNDRVAWGQPRDQLRMSVFSAVVVADAADQDSATLEHKELRRLPTLYPGEQQLPTGDGLGPPSQPEFEGMEPDLPALSADRSK